MEAFVSLISNVGFPIAACIVMYKQQQKLSTALIEQQSNFTVAVNELKETLKSVRDELNELKERFDK